jgi:hypothetical protein
VKTAEAYSMSWEAKNKDNKAGDKQCYHGKQEAIYFIIECLEAYLHKIRITNGGPQLCYLTSDPAWEFFDHFPSFVYVASSIVSFAQLVQCYQQSSSGQHSNNAIVFSVQRNKRIAMYDFQHYRSFIMCITHFNKEPINLTCFLN